MIKPSKMPCVIWGSSGHARVVLDACRGAGIYDVVALIDDVNRDRWGQEVDGVPVVGDCSRLGELRQRGVTHLLVGVGANRFRLEAARFGLDAGFELATVVHPQATLLTGARVGRGALIAARAVVGVGAAVGDLAIVNTAAVVDHDCVLGEGAHVAPGAILAGHVHIGTGGFVGAGAVVRDRVVLGAWAVVGAGAAVVRDVPDGAIVAGVPARSLSRSEDAP